ncbi:MAG: CusA/CzcA family heavy metal efflux RND transporter [Gammaproteobacteria bacterium]
MLAKLIRWSIDNRVLILVVTVLLTAWGWFSVKHIPLDAIPNLSDVQVIIRTSYPGQSPQVVEDQVTYPLTTTMLSVPGAKAVRGYSYFGDSYVYVIFKDHTNLYWARSRVLEYLSQAAADLPAGVHPHLGPDATGVGWVYEYALVDRSGKHDISQLRSLQDWYLKYELQTVPGVAQVATVGGMVRQYQIVVNPLKLRSYGITLSQLIRAIRRSNAEVGGSVVEMAESEYMIRSMGYLHGVKDLRNIPIITNKKGIPLLLGDLATVQVGPEMRRGIADLNGNGEVTGGIVVMRAGQNALQTISAVKKRLQQLQHGLPKGVQIVPTYDRSKLIHRAVNNLSGKLVEEFIVVALVCLLFLFHIRSAFVAIVTLPLGVLTAFIIMRWHGINANIMSLGGIAIAIGAMVDAAIVMIENAHKHIEHWHQQNPNTELHNALRWQLIANAASEVGPALFFSLLIITLSFVPVFSLQAQEGRMFAPLAYTKTYAMAAAAGLAVTLVPVLMGYFIRGRIPSESANPLSRVLIRIYQSRLKRVLSAPKKTLVIAAVLLVTIAIPIGGVGSLLAPLTWPTTVVDWMYGNAPNGSLRAGYEDTIAHWQNAMANSWRTSFSWSPFIARMSDGMGHEFMPSMFEGDLLYMPETLPGLSIGKAQQLLEVTDRLIKTVPEVKRVFGKIGRSDTATDPAPLTMIETVIQLKPQSQWRKGMTLAKLIHELNARVDLPGLTNAWLEPIRTRIDMLSTGIKTPVGVKVSGPDLKVIERIGREIEAVVKQVRGTASAYSDRVTGGRYIDVIPERRKAALRGVSIADINQVISAAVGGINVTYTVEGTERYPVNLRFAREDRDSVNKLRNLPIVTPRGQDIPLSEVCNIKVDNGPPVIKTENGRPDGWIFIDIHGVDLGSYVNAARKLVNKEVKLPPGYSISWTGQYRYMQRARAKLMEVIPFTLMIIFMLLYLTFRNIGEALLVLLTLPFALVGSYWFMLMLGYHSSVATAVGMIALAGVAAEFGVIMLIYLDNAVKERIARDEMHTVADLKAAIMEGAVMRIRPKAMTVTVIVAGLVPIMLGHGTGSEVMQRIAAPMIGGMVTAPLLSLFVVPVVYLLWKTRQLGLEKLK